jgi:hypothetical protein
MNNAVEERKLFQTDIVKNFHHLFYLIFMLKHVPTSMLSCSKRSWKANCIPSTQLLNNFESTLFVYCRLLRYVAGEDHPVYELEYFDCQ